GGGRDSGPSVQRQCGSSDPSPSGRRRQLGGAPRAGHSWPALPRASGAFVEFERSRTLILPLLFQVCSCGSAQRGDFLNRLTIRSPFSFEAESFRSRSEAESKTAPSRG